MTAVLLPAPNSLHLGPLHDGGQLACNRKTALTIPVRSEDVDDGEDSNDDEQPVVTHPTPSNITIVPNNNHDETTVVTTSVVPLPTTKSYGGIRNLGNTCYFNSALQLLASLDSFTQALIQNEPRNEGGNHDAIRKEFLLIMDALAKGDTVQPDSFKKALDARTPLFLGYRQQDSHEFLTTLLELLDEDYQKKPQEECDNHADETTASTSMEIDEHDEEPSEIQEAPLDESSCVDEMDLVVEQTLSSPIQRPRCLSDFDMDDITDLLNGSNSHQLDLDKAQSGVASDVKITGNFKLIGGRVNNTCTGVMVWLGAGVAQPDSCDEDTVISSTASSESADDASSAAPVVNGDNHAVDSFRSPVDDHFVTQVRVQLTCDSCKYTRSHRETYRHLSLEIGANGSSIEEGLRKLFAPEKRDIKCEKCFCECATQTTEIVRLPRALLLHFKRFIVDYSPDYINATYRKNHAEVRFDERLTIRGEDSVLEDFLGSDVTLPEQPLHGMTTTTSRCQPTTTPETSTTNVAATANCGVVHHHEYHIRGIVNHHGSSASCGHYNADALKLYYSGDAPQREWTRFNDSSVSKISSQQALVDSSRTAYMVVYELVTTTTTTTSSASSSVC